MSSKTVSMRKILGTLATLIWLFTSMSTYVFLRSEVLEEVLSHWLHWCGLSPVWVIIWVLRFLVWENTFSQWVHCYGFSLVWVLICLFSVLALGKAFPYWLHWCGFSPVWVIICLKTTSVRESLSILATLMCLFTNGSEWNNISNKFFIRHMMWAADQNSSGYIPEPLYFLLIFC